MISCHFFLPLYFDKRGNKSRAVKLSAFYPRREYRSVELKIGGAKMASQQFSTER